MAKSAIENIQELASNENSISTKEFLQIEKTCEGYKDSDEEIKQIFNEINKLSGGKNNNSIIGEDSDDVELILKRAEDLSQETQKLLKSPPSVGIVNENINEDPKIPQIKVTKPPDNDVMKTDKVVIDSAVKINATPIKHNKENATETIRRKSKVRPFSAGVIETKKREATKVSRFVTNSPKKSNCKHEGLIEELKDTNERIKSLELLNVQLTDDNRTMQKRLDEINEKKHIAELKLVECEKFVSRLGKEYENRNMELKSVKDNESKLTAELNKERNERKNLKILHDKDMNVIQDLQRQCKEMEMILKRKHPDSVSALIVASKSSTVEDNKKKLLEERTTRLEQELKDKEEHFQSILLTLQEKFSDMKLKYENHIIDVERQLMEDRKTNTELKNKLNKVNLIDSCLQTKPISQNTVGTQTFVKPSERASSAREASRLSQNSALLLTKLKEDSYLVATIKGLQAELTVKQRMIAKINRETEELRKNLRSLQKEKEVLLNLNPQVGQQKRIIFRQNKSAENLLAKVTTEMEAELSEVQKQKEVLVQERNSLLDSLKRTNEEFILLKKKRIQDLHTLQLAHEKELMQMNMQLYPLQEEIKLLNRTVEILQERLRNTEEKLMKYQTGMKDLDLNGGGDNNLRRGKKDAR